MTTSTPIRKIFEGVADRRQMFRLFDRHAQRPDRWADGDGALYAGEWFEIAETEHDYMLNLLPPLWTRSDMFALREFLTDSITSIFFALSIGGCLRHFHAYCDLSDRLSPDRMRAAILDRECEPGRTMTRTECLEHIWSETNDAFRGYTGDDWPDGDRGRRWVTVYGGQPQGIEKLLDSLTDVEIAAKLPTHRRATADAVAA